MGTSSDPPSDDPKRNIVMGYPPCHAQRLGYAAASSSSSTFQQYPHGCAPSPYQYPHGYPPPPSSYQSHHGYNDQTSPFQHDGKYMHPNAINPNSQPYNDYYYQQQYMMPMAQESGNSASFGRVMLILMVFLVASMFMMSLVMWFLFGTYIPEFEVTSIKVLNFTATNTTLTGIWSVQMSISNINKELNINFDHGLSSIFYKDAMLAISTLQPFEVEKKQKFDLNFSMPAESDGNKLQSWVLPTVAEDRSNGLVVFSLRLAVEANFTVSNIVYKSESLRVLCEDMEISFSPTTGEGTLSPGLENNCLIRLHDHDVGLD